MKIFLLPVLLCLGSPVLAQSLSSQVIAPAGSFDVNTNGSLSATIAQPIAGNLSNTVTLHQGFQVDLSSATPVITGIGEEESSVKIFPNPVSHHLFIERNNGANPYAFQLVDASGKIILEKQHVATPSTELDLSQLSPAVYFLLLRDASGKSRTITILKNN